MAVQARDMNYYKALIGDDVNQNIDLKAQISQPLVSRPNSKALPLPSRPKPLPLQIQTEGDVPLTSWSSAFIADKPHTVQERVVKLFSLQHKYTSLMMDYQEEALALERKYLALVQPLYAKRRETITGLRETVSTPPLSPTEGEGDEDEAGIPNFWLQVMKNEPSLSDLIAPRDEAVLSLLKDVKLEDLPNGERGFNLVFTFDENEYFWNTTLTKTYTYIRAADSGEDAVEDIYSAEYTYHESIGDEIHWKEGMNLVVEREEDEDGEQTASFFEFFRAPTIPDLSEDEEEDGEKQRTYDWLLEIDFDYGEVFKEKVIPYAVHWYTGEATLYEDIDEDESDDSSEEGEDEDEEHDGNEWGSEKEGGEYSDED